jgi:hypothetical protein
MKLREKKEVDFRKKADGIIKEIMNQMYKQIIGEIKMLDKIIK